MSGAIHPLPQYAFMAWCLVKKHSDNFTFRTRRGICLSKFHWPKFSFLAKFEVFTEVKIRVEVFWVLTPCNVAVGYQRFGGACCLHLQGEVFTLVSYRNTTRRQNPEYLDLNSSPLLKYQITKTQ